MIIDKETLFSEAQAITSTTASTNVYDTGATADSGIGTPMAMLLQCKQAFDNLTSLKVDLETSTSTAFSSAPVVASRTFALAELTANTLLPFPEADGGLQRYLRVKYTVTGTAPTVGTITAGLVLNNQQWAAIKSNPL